jgi:hypothetical protein
MPDIDSYCMSILHIRSRSPPVTPLRVVRVA